MDNLTPENHADLINHLKRLWGSDPGSYWTALRASGLTAQDVWSDAAVRYESREMARPETMKPPSKRKGAKLENQDSTS